MRSSFSCEVHFRAFSHAWTSNSCLSPWKLLSSNLTISISIGQVTQWLMNANRVLFRVEFIFVHFLIYGLHIYAFHKDSILAQFHAIGQVTQWIMRANGFFFMWNLFSCIFERMDFLHAHFQVKLIFAISISIRRITQWFHFAQKATIMLKSNSNYKNENFVTWR